jgi:sarcosine oxidase subunit beta
MKVLVVGGGIMGLAAARSLLQEGCTVTLIEQASVPNSLGASVDQHRLIRYPYGSARGYMRMVREAYAAWDSVWAELGATLYQETGTLVLGARGGGWAAESRAALEAEGVGLEPLDAAALAARYPMLDASGASQAFYCPSGGLLYAQAIVAALAAHLRRRGATLLASAKVSALDGERGEVRLADGRALRADCVLLAAGPWTARLVPALAEQARPTRQVVVYLAPPREWAAAWLRAPMLLDIGGASGFYLVPPRVTAAGMPLELKIGDHRFGPGGDPDRDREPSAAEVEAILAQARSRLPRLDSYRITAARTCLYDVAPDERFRLRRLGARGFAFCGSSGHGFKFGPVVGEAIAAVITGRADYERTAARLAGETSAKPC